MQVAREAFGALDTDNDGCLVHLDVVRLVRQFVPGGGGWGGVPCCLDNPSYTMLHMSQASLS